MFTLALVIFKLISWILHIIEQADQNPSVYNAVGKFVFPMSTITLYLKHEPNSQTLNFLSCLNLEASHLATAAELHWKSNARHMEEYSDAVHIFPTCELNPVMVAVSSMWGLKSGSRRVWLTMGENRRCLREFEGPTLASGGLPC